MKQKSIIAGLVLANVALGATLAWRATSNVAQAQPMPAGANPPARGNYLMIPGYSQSLNASIIYIFDAQNHRLGGVAPDANNQFSPMATIALDPIFDAASQSDAAHQTPRGRPGMR